MVRKARTNKPGRVSGDNGVGRDIFGHDRARGNHDAVADLSSRQHNGTVADPDIMADDDATRSPPFEELSLVDLAREIAGGTIGEMRLAGALHRVIAGIDPGHRRDRAELAKFRVSDIAVVDDIRIVADLGFEQGRACADIGVTPKRAIVHFRGRMDERLLGQNLFHVSSTNATRSEAKRDRVVRMGTQSVSASTLSTTSSGRPSASFRLSASAASATAAVTRVLSRVKSRTPKFASMRVIELDDIA